MEGAIARDKEGEGAGGGLTAVGETLKARLSNQPAGGLDQVEDFVLLGVEVVLGDGELGIGGLDGVTEVVGDGAGGELAVAGIELGLGDEVGEAGDDDGEDGLLVNVAI